MSEFKVLSSREIKKLSDSERYEYQLAALDYYGNLKNQLSSFEDKEKYHKLLLGMVSMYPINIVKLNEIEYPQDGKNAIFSANHSNASDFIVVSRLIKKHFFIMADFTMINDNVVNFLNTANGCIYVDRLSKTSGQNAIEQAIDGVNKGYNMMIFPEGTWNLTKDQLMLPRKWGDIIVAQNTGRPIIPIGLVYNCNNCFVKFGKPFYVSKNDSIKEKDEELFNIMVNLRKEIIESAKYKILEKPISYEEWLINTIKSYKHFDVDYELSVIRNNGVINDNELAYIRSIGEQIHSEQDIENRLRNSQINYRIGR